MTDHIWPPGAGLGRADLADGPAMVLYRPGARTAYFATVNGLAFTDLPALLDAADGDPSRIQPGRMVILDMTDLLSPAGRPRKIICVAQNPTPEDDPTGVLPSPHPELLPKWDNTLTGPYAGLALPPRTHRVDSDGGLAVVIGRRCRGVSPENVADVVFGYTIMNNGSVREHQVGTGDGSIVKAWDGLTPLGPVIIPAGQLGGIKPDLHVTARLNGETVQDYRTNAMRLTIADLVTYLTKFLTLEPGDLIMAASPAGTLRRPTHHLIDGDEFEVRVQGIGVLHNRYHAENQV